MKSVLTLLLAVLLLGVAAGAGYVVYQRRQLQTTVPASASASSKTPERPVIENPKTEADRALAASTTDPVVLEKMMYELKKNSDVVGWLQVPGTDIDSAVVQSQDNSFYLRRDERKQDSLYGCYFADYECSVADRQNLTPNTVIYGHSDLKDNPDGPKFSQLFRFADDAFAAENQTIRLSTPEETMEWEIFAAFYTDVSFDYIRIHNTPEEQQQLIDKAVSLSVRNYGRNPTAEDRILTLSTCSVRDGNDGNHRFVVMARLK